MIALGQCGKCCAIVQLTKKILPLIANDFRCLVQQSASPSAVAICGSKVTRNISTGKFRNLNGILTDPENKGDRQTGVNFDTIGSWNNRIEMPVSIKTSIEKGMLIPEIPIKDVGTKSLLGHRKENQDRFIVKKLTENILCFAIFDGHGGSAAVDFVHQNIEHHLLYWLNRTDKLSDVLHNTFADVNDLLSEHLAFAAEGLTGTTATVCLLRNGTELVVANVGDSRAIICRDGAATRLSKDHTPEDCNEIARIEEAGGRIIHNSQGVANVNGRLSMTRSIGDFELKPYGVTAEPSVEPFKVKHGKDSMLVLVTDGLSFVLNDQELIDIIGSCETPIEAASVITDQALQFGSEDNATAVIVPFGAWGKFRNGGSIPYRFGRHLSSQRY
ncbi:protein phosphatase 1K, mitochondrial-like [Dreissena polymorpha]|uniref:PPM-type phosphatase domain-containing protein n=1 Tax=Dreissena polymorpha TaxID=45954 RepID=A0A9D4QUF9_DREPO|nr:protein phosphatase 1K, mitochondrial-like [Dreissena polymorpha]KAH3843448.1 hypothetical protein DPMN_116966 [Dreissena polymorpha]